MTASELLDLARGTSLAAGPLADLARRLPDDDAVASALKLACADADGAAFTVLLTAALGGGRHVDLPHIEDGVRLVPPFLHPPILTRLGPAAVPAFVTSLKRHPQPADDTVATLLAAAILCREHTVPLPDGFVALARQSCRTAFHLGVALPILLAHVLDDEGLYQALGIRPRSDAESIAVVEGTLARFRRDIASDLFAITARVAAAIEPIQSATVRRAVSRVGRNDPCPCGSGRKYKRCCFAGDQERLRDSSDVAGVTRTELRRDVTPYLTRERIDAMSPFELAQIARKPLPEALSVHLLHRLRRFGELEAFAERLEMVGYREEVDELVADAIGSAASRNDRNLVRRLVDLRGGRLDDVFASIAARMLYEDPPRAALDLIEREATSVLRQRDDRPLTAYVGPYAEVDLAYDVLRVAPALGIFVARAVLHHAVGLDAEMLLDALLEARDNLGITPHDPAERIVYARLERDNEITDRDKSHDPEWSALQIELDEKTAQTRRLREEAAELRRELQATNAKAAAALAATRAASSLAAEPAAEPAQVADLRRRLRNLATDLSGRQEEQARLRREVERLRREAAARPAVTNSTAVAPNADDDDSHVNEAESDLGIQPLRLPHFSPAFADAVERLPQAVLRAAMTRIGRLAAGEAEAFHGVRRLRSQRDVWRIRIGISHRLLARLEPKTLEILALVPRQDLERAIKALAASKPPR